MLNEYPNEYICKISQYYVVDYWRPNDIDY